MVKDFDYGELYRNRATEKKLKDSLDIILDLKDTLRRSDRFILCANEIGYDARIIAVKSGDNYTILINPVYKSVEDRIPTIDIDPETDKKYLILRSKLSTVQYQSETGKLLQSTFKDEASILLDTAMCCLDGLHCSDFGLELSDDFFDATDAEKAEIIKLYVESLTELADKLDKDLSEDEKTSHYWIDYKFKRAVALGEVKVVDKPENRKTRRLIDKLKRRRKS